MIVLINPNSTAAMTEAMRAAAASRSGGIAVEGWTSHEGPPAIQGPEDGAAAVPPLLPLVRRASDAGAQAVLIGCFDDTGLAEAQGIADCPVIGIGQAACAFAALAGGRYSVVTTLAVSVPVLEANIRAYRLDHRLARVRASGVPVLEVERARARVIEEIRAAEREDGVKTVVLGCGGMVDLVDRAAEFTGLRLIDGVRAATAAACGMIAGAG